jgi:hypothetical protein
MRTLSVLPQNKEGTKRRGSDECEEEGISDHVNQGMALQYMYSLLNIWVSRRFDSDIPDKRKLQTVMKSNLKNL